MVFLTSLPASVRDLASELSLVRTASGETRRAAARGEVERVGDAASLAERERESGGEAVAAAVHVDGRPRHARGGPLAGASLARPRTAVVSHRGHRMARRRVELSRGVALARVLPAPDERVELD